MSYMEIDKNGAKVWRNSRGQCHRENGPAVEYTDGTKEWHINGKCHRENGPAIEYADGTREWCIKGKYHREDGPAVEYPHRSEFWYNGKPYSLENWLNNLNISDAEKIHLYMKWK